MPHPAGVGEDSYPRGAVIPGLVNAHTHLELTGLETAVDPMDFAAWIRMVRELKSRRMPADFLAAARQGIADCWASGITTVADTGDSGAVIEALAESGASGVAYVEVFGPHPDQRSDSLADLERRVGALRRFARERVRIGVSPHAPYSVSGPLYEAVAAWARNEGLPLAVHIAESAPEYALLATGTGAFAEMWSRRGIPMPAPPGDTPLQWLARHRVLGPDTLCIHVVKAGASDVALLAETGSAVGHCPLSNRAHGHGDAPIRDFIAAGIRMGCGTDSILSIDRMDLLAEARVARALGDLSAAAALGLCTLESARAIGMGNEVGSLEAGKWGDAAAIDLSRTPQSTDPVEAVLVSGPEDVLATYLAGRNVFRRDPMSPG